MIKGCVELLEYVFDLAVPRLLVEEEGLCEYALLGIGVIGVLNWSGSSWVNEDRSEEL